MTIALGALGLVAGIFPAAIGELILPTIYPEHLTVSEGPRQAWSILKWIIPFMGAAAGAIMGSIITGQR